jgi:hypothetical protein
VHVSASSAKHNTTDNSVHSSIVSENCNTIDDSVQVSVSSEKHNTVDISVQASSASESFHIIDVSVCDSVSSEKYNTVEDNGHVFVVHAKSLDNGSDINKDTLKKSVTFVPEQTSPYINILRPSHLILPPPCNSRDNSNDQNASNKKGRKGKKKVSFHEISEDLNNGNNYTIDDILPRSNQETLSFKEASSSSIRHTRKHPTNLISPNHL